MAKGQGVDSAGNRFEGNPGNHLSLCRRWRAPAHSCSRRGSLRGQGGGAMTTPAAVRSSTNLTVVKGLTYVMFAMFAMTTDSVGIIIPEIVKTFGLSLTAAGTFQYATMGGIALAGFLLGHLADRHGRKSTIVAGLTLFALSSYLFVAGSSF